MRTLYKNQSHSYIPPIINQLENVMGMKDAIHNQNKKIRLSRKISNICENLDEEKS